MKDKLSAYAYDHRIRQLVARRSDIEHIDGALQRPRQLLVAQDGYDAVRSELSKLKIATQALDQRAGTDVVALAAGTPFAETLDRLEQSLGAAGRVGPNHVFVAAPHIAWGPGGEPRELSALSWSPVDSSDAEGVRVGIVDTGLLPEHANQPWLTDVHCDPDDIEVKDVDGNGHIDPVVGHGTFIAGVVRRWARRATIHIDKALSVDGLCDELTLADAINQALDRDPHILSLSLGAYTRKNEAPIGLEMVWQRIRDQHPNLVVVSAAGNDGQNKKFWPAATDSVVGVGAVDDSNDRADFSNFGPWVDVWAAGVDIESAFADGSYLPLDGSGARSFTGICQWSGTSFATPLAAAAIASRMSRDGVTARGAYDRIKADAQNVPGVGKVVTA
ncbi:MAG: S8 family serine peptidase [Mycobacteriales bacterium]